MDDLIVIEETAVLSEVLNGLEPGEHHVMFKSGAHVAELIPTSNKVLYPNVVQVKVTNDPMTGTWEGKVVIK